MGCIQNNPILSQGVRLPHMEEVEPLQQRFTELDQEAMQLLLLCLAPDPNDRPSASELLQLPYFEGVDEMFDDDFRRAIERDREASAAHPKRRRLKKGASVPQDPPSLGESLGVSTIHPAA